MIVNPEYRDTLGIQVDEMLRLAKKKSRAFSRDCLSDPGKLREHWARHLDITYYSPREHDQIDSIRNDERIVDDNASFADLLGFFSPSPSPGTNPDKAYVAWSEGTYTTRRNFTLLHEIGHYLQETDFGLTERICSFESDYIGKRFEEDACNRFASMSLLPDEFIARWLDSTRSPSARDIHDIFEDGRNCSPRRHAVRVSRIAVVRRIGALLPSLGYASLIKKPYGKDARPEVVCRAWNDGSVDFSPEFTTAETMLYERARMSGRLWEGAGFASDTRMFLGVSAKERPLRGNVTFSYGRQEHVFMVVEYPEWASRDAICAGGSCDTSASATVRDAMTEPPDYVLAMEHGTMSAFAEWDAGTPRRETGKPLSERTVREQVRRLDGLGESLREMGLDGLADGLSGTVFSYDTPEAFSPVYDLIRDAASGVDSETAGKVRLLPALARYDAFLNVG